MSRIFYVSLLSVAVAACSSVEQKQADGGFEYTKYQEPKPIVAPEGLKLSQPKDEFAIPPASKVHGPVGEQIDVRAPSLVLPIAASSRVVTNTSDAIIWFDKVLEDRDLLEFIQIAIKEQLAEDNVDILQQSEDGMTMETDWFHQEQESGVMFKSIELAESMRFGITLTTKPHGRSVSVQAKLLEYLRTDQQGGSRDIDPIDKHRAEIALLNNITSQVDYRYRIQARENRLMRASQKIVSLGENVESEPAFIIEMAKDQLWSNLPIFFERYGFKITDINESKKIYYVAYEKPESSVWDMLWGDEQPVIEIENSSYQFLLEEVEGDKTALTIYDANDAPLSIATVEKIFPVMEVGLSFRDF